MALCVKQRQPSGTEFTCLCVLNNDNLLGTESAWLSRQLSNVVFLFHHDKRRLPVRLYCPRRQTSETARDVDKKKLSIMRKGDIPCCLAVFFNPQPVDLTLHDYTTLPLLLLASCQRSEAFVFPSLHSDDRPVIPLFLSGKKGRGYSCTFGLENDIPLPA